MAANQPNALLFLTETPSAEHMLVGFEQWANAGNVSSGTATYLVEKLNARKIGGIRKGGFYLFQLPARQYMFRPQVRFKEGCEEFYQEAPANDFYYAEVGGRALVVFIGTEPIQHEDQYAAALLDGAQALGVKRIVVTEGVATEVPFDKERHISVVFSSPDMRQELGRYAVSFSNYGMTATIGMVLNHYAAKRGVELVRMAAWAPAYGVLYNNKPLIVADDKKAWLDVLRRVRRMFEMELDLSDLEAESETQIAEMRAVFKQLEQDPQATAYFTYLQGVFGRFKERRFEEPVELPSGLRDDIEEILRRTEAEGS